MGSLLLLSALINVTMSILIGGSPSTGSSLLRRILNRHSAIFCGSETSLFAKSELYLDWGANKNKLLRPSLFGLSNAGWHRFIGIDLAEEYNTDRNTLRTLINNNDSFKAFINALYNPILKNTDKTIWAEKTPSNAFTLSYFLQEFENGKVIHTVRDPLDTIASLYNRGMSVFNAVAVYMLNTAMASQLHNDNRNYTIKYEDLVASPEKTVNALCNFIDVTYESTMLLPDKKPSGDLKMEGWNYKETDTIGAKSIGRYAMSSPDIQNEILDAVLLMRATIEDKIYSVEEVCKLYGYEIPNHTVTAAAPKRLALRIKADIKDRYFSKAYYKAANYPITLSNNPIT